MDNLPPEELERILYWDSPFPYQIIRMDCEAGVSEIISSNPAFQKLVGYTDGEMLGRNAYLFVYPSDLAYFHREFTKLWKGGRGVGTVINGYVRFLHKDLSGTPIACYVTCWRSPETGPCEVLVISCIKREAIAILRKPTNGTFGRSFDKLLDAIIANPRLWLMTLAGIFMIIGGYGKDVFSQLVNLFNK